MFSVSAYDYTNNGSSYISVGAGGNSIATSTDGTNWVGIGLGPFSKFGTSVDWNGTYLLAFGSGTNTIATSADGLSWTGQGYGAFSTYGSEVLWNTSNTTWYGVGNGGNTIATSTDGINWSGNSSVFLAYGHGIAQSTGTNLVAFGQGGNTIAYTSNGTTWTGKGNAVFSIAGFGGVWSSTLARWIAVGCGGNTIATSSDGNTWTGQIGPFSQGAYKIMLVGSTIVAFGQGGNSMAYSTNGTTWTGISNNIFAGSGIKPTGPMDNLALYYTFESTTISGTTVLNCANNLYDLTLYNNPSFSNINYAVGTKSILFNGTASQVALVTTSSLNLTGISAITTSFWINLPFNYSFSDNCFFIFSTPGGNATYMNNYTSGVRGSDFTVTVNNLNFFTLKSSASITLGTWYHIVWVARSTSPYWVFYVNGVQSTATGNTFSGNYANSFAYYSIGSANYGQNVNGYYDDYRLYYRELSQSEVNIIYNMGSIAPSPIINTLIPDVFWFKDGSSISGTALTNSASGSVGNGSIWTVNGSVTSSTTSPAPPTGFSSYLKIVPNTNNKCVITTPTFALPAQSFGNGYTLTMWIYFNTVSSASGGATSATFYQLSGGTNISTQGSLSGVTTGGLLSYINGTNGTLIDHSNLGNITFVNSTTYYPFNANTWYHIGLVCLCANSGTGLTGKTYCYVNGVAANNITASTGYPSGSPVVNFSMGIGSLGSCNVAGIRVYSKPLESNQVASIYANMA